MAATRRSATLVPFIPVVLVLIAENFGHLTTVVAMTGRALFADGVVTTLAGGGGGAVRPDCDPGRPQ